jgi:hypothetical protein
MLLFVWFVLSILGLFFFQATPPDSTDIGPIVALIMARALQLTGIVNVLTNVFAKYLANASGLALPAVAVALGIAIDFGILAIGGSPFNRQTVVMAIVAGALAGAGSKLLADVHDATTTKE